MAATAGFKQACPSCDALVPIRDRKLIGRKVDCPKCKYRFVVEDPEAAADDGESEEERKPAKAGGKLKVADKITVKRPGSARAAPVKGKPGAPKRAPEDDGDDRPANKKRSFGSRKLLVGIGLAVVAVVVLGIGIFLAMGGSEPARKKETSSRNTPSNPRAAAVKPTESKPAPTKKEKPEPPAVLTDITNLLPADAQAVFVINGDRFASSMLGEASLSTSEGLQAAQLTRYLGFPVTDIARLIRAERYHGTPWSFNVVRTSAPVNREDLASALALKPAKTPKGKDYFVIAGSDLLDGLGKLLLRIRQAPDPAGKGPATGQPRPFGLCILDTQTLVFADVPSLQKLLDMDKEPKKPPEPAKSPGAKPPQGKDSRAKPPAAEAAPAPSPPAGPYATIDPSLRQLMEQLDNPKEPAILAGATLDVEAIGALYKHAVDPAGADPTTDLDQVMKSCRAIGLSVKKLKEDRFTGTLALEGKTGIVAQSAADLFKDTQKQQRFLRDLPTFLGLPVPALPQAVAMADSRGGRPAKNARGSQPASAASSPAPVSVATRDKSVFISVDLPLGDAGSVAQDQLRAKALVFRGLVEMAGRKSRIHELADALRACAKQTGKFPMGAYPRKSNAQRAGLPWPPNERVSWMVHLLPYLPQFGSSSDGEASEEKKQPLPIQLEESWRSPKNLLPAATLIPQFLDPATPDETWWAQYPGALSQVAATQFVGIAGIGLDAADYLAKDPATAKKRGIFGYDRETALTDVSDGLDKTIAILQVPPEFKTPWMAGGGSTIRGVPETDSVRPFVCVEYKGKRGTFAIMADGKVRFIPETISDKDFLALCTINGGEAVDVDKLAPVVPAPAAAKK